MAETKFIKAAVFGGYDKTDVDKRLEFLYGLVYDLKNELRETKLLLKEYQSGSDAEKSFEAVLANEKAQLTQVQVKNENLSEKNKSIREELRIKEAENAELVKTVDKLKKQLADAELKITSMDKSSADAFTVIFAEAQKSHDNIVATAKEKAKECEESTRRFVEEFIIDANNQASKTVYEAERKAAEIIADAKNEAEQMRASGSNLRAIMHEEVNELAAKVSELRGILANFSTESLAVLTHADEVLENTDNTLQSGGTPVFVIPENIQPEYPEEPVYQQKPKPVVPEKKNNSELEKLQAMAEAIGGGKEQPKKSGGISLGDLAKQAESLESGNKVSETPVESPKNSKPKKGGLDLADLMKQANSLGN